MSLTRFSVRNPVFVNLLLAVLIAAGIPSYFLINRELFPIIPQNRVQIFTAYPDASPEDMEKQITAVIEREITSLSGIDKMTSISVEGLSIITLELAVEANPDAVIRDVQAQIDAIDTFPEDAEDPVVREMEYNWPVVNLGLSGPVSEKRLKQIAEDLRDYLIDIEGVNTIQIAGVREREIQVLADPDRLYAYQVSLPALALALRRYNQDLPAGTLKASRQEFLVRTHEDLRSLGDIENVILHDNSRGGRVQVRDVARVVDTFEDRNFLTRINGTENCILMIMKKGAGDTLYIKKKIEERVKEFIHQTPEPIVITPYLDFSFAIRERIAVMQYNGLLGLFLVLTLLCLFLNYRMAFMVALGIPFAFFGAFIFMYIFGISLNMLSMFGMILVLGMIVDDAIIIAENAYRYMEKGMSRTKAAILGTEEVVWPVFAAISTTVAAFLPLLLMEGLMGKFMSVIPIVVTLCLCASLFEAYVVLPSHIAEWSEEVHLHGPDGPRKKPAPARWYRGLFLFYQRLLKMCLRHRYVTLAVVMTCFFFTVWFAYSRMDFILFQNRDINYFRINVDMPVGSRLEKTSEVLQRLEDAALQLPAQELDGVVAFVGYQVDEWAQFHQGSHFGQIWVDLAESSKRQRIGQETMEDYRRLMPSLIEAESVSLEKEAAGPPQGKAVVVRLRGEDFAILRSIGRDVQQTLHTIDGVVDIRDNFLEGKTELRIDVDRNRAAQVGLTPEDVAATLRFCYEGGKAGRYFDLDEDLDIIVRLDEADRGRLETLRRLRFLNPQGKWVPFDNVASVHSEQGLSQVTRFNNRRSLTVSADVDTTRVTSVEANRLLKEHYTPPDMPRPGTLETLMNLLFARVASEIPSRDHPGYTLSFEGENEDTLKSLSSLLRAFVLSLLVIYFILTTIFRSYLQPLVVLLTIPFSFIGVILGLHLMGQPLSVMSLIGVIALNGIVVNDAIVLVDFINQARFRGSSRWRSVYESGLLRIRPILLTSITTIGGLLPLTVWASGTSEFLTPMAIAISWGLAFSTFLTLLVLPCVYCILDDLKTFLGRPLFHAPPSDS